MNENEVAQTTKLTDEMKLAIIDEILANCKTSESASSELVKEIAIYWQEEMFDRKRIEKKENKDQRKSVLNSPLLTYEAFQRDFEGQDRDELINRLALSREHYREAQELSGEVNFFLRQLEDVKVRELEDEDARQPLIEQCAKAYNDKVIELINHIHPSSEKTNTAKQD